MSNVDAGASQGLNDAEGTENQIVAGINEGNPTVENPTEMEVVPPNIQMPLMAAGGLLVANPVVPEPVFPNEENGAPPGEENQAAPVEENETSPLAKSFGGILGVSSESH
ncbi:hypothetical protein FRC12_004030 [Ceratobasidium sp. 428]|nr:hypothetical protein FRC12_004030 [Ceratobasidium sp. 428]